MYIRSVSQKNRTKDEMYTTYRLVESYRNTQGKVRQQVLLNLGAAFSIPKEKWGDLANRVEEIRNGQEALFNLDTSLENEAQRIAKLLIHKSSFITSVSSNSSALKVETDYQTVDVNSLTITLGSTQSDR